MPGLGVSTVGLRRTGRRSHGPGHASSSPRGRACGCLGCGGSGRCPPPPTFLTHAPCQDGRAGVFERFCQESSLARSKHVRGAAAKSTSSGRRVVAATATTASILLRSGAIRWVVDAPEVAEDAYERGVWRSNRLIELQPSAPGEIDTAGRQLASTAASELEGDQFLRSCDDFGGPSAQHATPVVRCGGSSDSSSAIAIARATVVQQLRRT